MRNGESRRAGNHGAADDDYRVGRRNERQRSKGRRSERLSIVSLDSSLRQSFEVDVLYSCTAIDSARPVLHGEVKLSINLQRLYIVSVA